MTQGQKYDGERTIHFQVRKYQELLFGRLLVVQKSFSKPQLRPISHVSTLLPTMGNIFSITFFKIGRKGKRKKNALINNFNVK